MKIVDVGITFRIKLLFFSDQSIHLSMAATMAKKKQTEIKDTMNDGRYKEKATHRHTHTNSVELEIKNEIVGNL